MTFPFRIVVAAAMAVAGALLPGCSGLKQPYPARDFYALNPGPPPHSATAAPGSPVLQVARLRAASPYDETPFVYKTGEGRFFTDYYNGFITQADRMATAGLVEWLAASGLFANVVDSYNPAGYSLLLQGSVMELYGDYSDKAAPKAVMALKVFVMDDSQVEVTIVFTQTYRQAVPVQGGDAASLVKGWDQAYRNILSDLVADLRRQKPRLVPAAATSRPATQAAMPSSQ